MSLVKYIFSLSDVKLKYKKQKMHVYFSKGKTEVITAESGGASQHVK